MTCTPEPHIAGLPPSMLHRQLYEHMSREVVPPPPPPPPPPAGLLLAYYSTVYLDCVTEALIGCIPCRPAALHPGPGVPGDLPLHQQAGQCGGALLQNRHPKPAWCATVCACCVHLMGQLPVASWSHRLSLEVCCMFAW